MKIEKGTAHGKYAYWTVRVDPHELSVASGKTLPYSTWIGTIDETGKINIWTPAASVPRGYKDAAKVMLEEARDQLGIAPFQRGSKRHRRG